MKKEIAFFDFDGTITTKDTLLEFIKFVKGDFRFWLGFLLNAPFIIAYKLKIISNQRAKEKILQFFFKGTEVRAFQKQCDLFSKNILPTLIRPKALEEIVRLRENGVEVVIVSASPENWIQQWADYMQMRLLASKLEVCCNKITGRILGKNCHGNEKVRRITECYSLSNYNKVYVYGDSQGDMPMLKLATSGYYKPFRP